MDASAVTTARPPIKLWMWAAWALVSAAAYASVWKIVSMSSSIAVVFAPVVPFWVMALRMQIAPALGIAALALPVVALLMLLWGRFYPSVLIATGVIAALLFAYAGLETYFVAHEPAAETPFPLVAEPGK